MAVSRALVTGGTGAVGREVVRGLRKAGIETVFTFLRSEEVALSLAQETGARSQRIDLRQPCGDALAELGAFGVFIHCAVESTRGTLAELTIERLESAFAVNCRSALFAVKALAGRGALTDVVLVGALDRTQVLPLPVHFAATQGMLGAMVGALAKELGPEGVRVNLIALGPLEAGIGQALDPKLAQDYRAFSALRRNGKTDEVARAILWLALENRYMSGKTVSVNGGL